MPMWFYDFIGEAPPRDLKKAQDMEKRRKEAESKPSEFSDQVGVPHGVPRGHAPND